MAKIVIVTDGGHEMGMGHVMRCLSLAKVLRNDKVDAIFYCGGDVVRQKIESERFDVIRADNIDKTIDEERPNVLFIDLPPHINRSCYIGSAKKSGIVSIAFDDILINGERADVVINPSLKSPPPPFSKGGIGGIYYGGAEYAVINDSFLPPLNPLLCKEGKGEVKAKEIRKKGRNVLISMGGSDPARQTEKILKVLMESISGVSIDVVVGMAYKSISNFQFPISNLKVYHNIKNMAGLMTKADMAFVAGGITLYEAAFVGLPVIVIAQDKYQALTAKGFQKRGFGIYLGMFNEASEDLIKNECIGLLDDYSRRKEMSDKGKKLVDGKGVYRVVEIIKKFLTTKSTKGITNSQFLISN